MTLIDLLRLSGGALRGHRLRTSLSVLGVAIGVSSVILLTSLGEGARLYLVQEFFSLGSNLLVVLPGKTETTGSMIPMGGTPNDLTIEDAEAVAREVRGVRRVAPLAIGAAAVTNGEKRRDAVVVGTTAHFLRIRDIGIATGRFLPSSDMRDEARICVIGATIRRELFGRENPVGRMIRIGEARYRIIGALEEGGVSIGGDVDEMVFLPVKGAMRLLDRAGLFRLFVEAVTTDDLPRVKAEMATLLKERHRGVEDITIFTPDAVLASFQKILQTLTLVLAAIAGISLGVAGIGIMNVMLVSVSERTREIGLMKAIGATTGQILGLILVEATILSATGGALGLGIGMAGARLLRQIYPVFPATPPDWAVAAAVIVSIAVGIVFGLVPARRATRLDPITALARR
jgi:putative ABC transport system permease protein